MWSDCRPSSLAIWAHTFRSKPSVVSIRRLTSVDGDLSSRNRRTDRRSSSCSSEKAKFTGSPSLWCSLSPVSRLPGFPGQSEDALTDDVLLDLARAGVDGLRPGEHVRALQVVEDVLASPGGGDDLAGGAEDVHRQLAEVAVPGAPVELADRRLGADDAGAGQRRLHPHPVVGHDLPADA